MAETIKDTESRKIKELVEEMKLYNNPQELEDATGGNFLEDIIDTITTPIRKIVEPLKPSEPMAPLPFPQDRRGNKP